MKNYMPELKPGSVIEMSNGDVICIMDNLSPLKLDKGYINKIYYPKERTALLFTNGDEILRVTDIKNTINDNKYWELIWEKSSTDWTKVSVDTKVLVRDEEDAPWEKRHFAGLKDDGSVITYVDGRTSFTTKTKLSWRYAVRYEGNEQLVGENK
jgi:hypothetical protein